MLRIRLLSTLSVLLLAAFCAMGTTVEYGPLVIRGDAEFIDRTREALALLEELAPDAFEKICTYVGLIDQGEHSAMWAYEDPPRYEVGGGTASYSTTWYASTIAHDATHSELYHEYVAAHPSHRHRVPTDVWAGVSAERFCLSYQLEVLKAIGGPPHEIEYLAKQTGTHCDVDGDGDCDWDDYENRDW